MVIKVIKAIKAMKEIKSEQRLKFNLYRTCDLKFDKNYNF